MFFYFSKNGGLTWKATLSFPPASYALEHGLLCFGGEYSADCFYQAYSQGVFPWPSTAVEAEQGDDYEIPWFSPDPRFVLYPEQLHVSHSLKKTLKHGKFSICADRAFRDVIFSCASCHYDEDQGGWLTNGLMRSMIELHKRGIAHSIESYLDGELVGGFYGLQLGRVFVGESMFTKVPDASKAAFVTFVKRAAAFGIGLIDCEDHTDNLARFGAQNIPRAQYLAYLRENLNFKVSPELWAGDWQSEP